MRSTGRVGIVATVVAVAAVASLFVVWRVDAGRKRSIDFWKLPLANTVRITRFEFEAWMNEHDALVRTLASYPDPDAVVSGAGATEFRSASRWLELGSDTRFIGEVRGDSTLVAVICSPSMDGCRGPGSVLDLRRVRLWLDARGLPTFEASAPRHLLLAADPRSRLFPRITAWALGTPPGFSSYLRPQGDSVEIVRFDSTGALSARWHPRTSLGEVERYALDSTGTIFGRASDGTPLLATAAPSALPGWRILRSLRADRALSGVAAAVVRETLLSLVFVGALLGVILWSRRGAAQERAERLATEARLDALRAQLRPHFLFNALNTIAEFVHEDPPRADAMLVQLGELLQQSLSDADAAVVTLHREVELLEAYLAIERLRFGAALVVDIEIPEALRDAAVPSWLLQPVLENAIKFGGRSGGERTEIRVTARSAGGRLTIEVRDPGTRPEGPVADLPSHGLGLANVRARLRTLYGAHAELRIGPVADPQELPGTVVTIDLPLSVAADAPAAAVS